MRSRLVPDRPSQVNVSSLEDVIKYLLKVASDRAEAASKAAEAQLDVEVCVCVVGCGGLGGDGRAPAALLRGAHC